MEPMSESTDDIPTRTRSLRARQSSVNYREIEDDGNEDHSVKSYSKEKKRGSKRKAEVNIESLYTQENVKDVNPSSLETIFECPKREQSRSKMKKNMDGIPSEEQLMSLKKLRRFCSFSDYFNPPKQKIKARKDRAKKLKQLTGVKVPKGSLSNEALLTALSVLSEEEDHIESMPAGLCKEALSDCHHVKNLSEDTSSFYVGNVIRPDTQDAAMNEVIKNISMMQMENEFQDKDLLSQALCKDLEESLLFSNENENPNLQSVQIHQKKSRRRSQKFSGSLLPPLYANCKDEECTELKSVDTDISEGSAICNMNSLNLAEDNINKDDIMNTISNTPKRRNILSDQKVVKKTKRLESTLKRESEYVDQKCLKKRGNLKGKIGKFYDGQDTDAGNCTKDFSVDDAPSESSVYQSPKIEKEVLVSPHSEVKVNVPVKGKKRGKRRVSGIKRPLYRMAPEPTTPGKELNDSDSFSSNHPATQALVTQAEGSSAVLASSEQNTSHNLLSSTSPCSQMAALSLQSPDTVQQEKSRTRRQSERIRRNSVKLSRGSLDKSVTSGAPISLAVSSSVSSVVLQSEIDRSNLKVQKQKGRRLSNMFSQLELRTESKDHRIYQSVSCETVEEDSLHSNLYTGYSGTDPILSVVSTNCESIQTVVPVIDKQNVNQSFSSEGDYNSRVCSEHVLSKLTSNSENNTNNQFEFQKPSCDDATHTAEHGGQSLNGPQVMNATENSKTHIVDSKLNSALHKLEEDFEHNSPIITGMFENKVGIRLGKAYHNQEALVSKSDTLEPFNYPHNKNNFAQNS